MKRLGFAASALLVTALAGVAAVQLLRTRLETSESLRGSLVAAVESQLGVRLDPGPLAVDFWPAGVTLSSPGVGLPGGGRIELPATRLDLDRGGLLDGRAQLRSLRFVEPGAGSPARPARLERGGVALVGVLRGGLQPDPDGAGWRVDSTLALETGGSVALRGVASAAGFRGSLEVDAVDGAPFEALLVSDRGEPARLRGRYSGRLELPAESPDAPALATLRLHSDAAEIRLPRLRLEGPVTLVAELPFETGEPRGFAIDASRAQVEYAGARARARGDGASVEGRIARDDEGRWQLSEVALKIQGFRGELHPGGLRGGSE